MPQTSGGWARELFAGTTSIQKLPRSNAALGPWIRRVGEWNEAETLCDSLLLPNPRPGPQPTLSSVPQAPAGVPGAWEAAELEGRWRRQECVSPPTTVRASMAAANKGECLPGLAGGGGEAGCAVCQCLLGPRASSTPSGHLYASLACWLAMCVPVTVSHCRSWGELRVQRTKGDLVGFRGCVWGCSTGLWVCHAGPLGLSRMSEDLDQSLHTAS